MPRPLAVLAIIFAIVVGVAAVLLYRADRQHVLEVAERAAQPASSEPAAGPSKSASAGSSVKPGNKPSVGDAPATAENSGASKPTIAVATAIGEGKEAAASAEQQPAPTSQAAAAKPAEEQGTTAEKSSRAAWQGGSAFGCARAGSCCRGAAGACSFDSRSVGTLYAHTRPDGRLRAAG